MEAKRFQIPPRSYSREPLAVTLNHICMKINNTFKIIWWILLLLITSGFLLFRLNDIVNGKSVPFDIFLFIIFVALMLAPIFSEVEIFGIKLKQEIQDLKHEINLKFGDIKNEIRNSQNQTLNATFHGFGPPPPDNKIPELEQKIDQILKAQSKSNIHHEDIVNRIEIPQDSIEMFKVRFSIEKEIRRIWEQRFSQESNFKNRHLTIMKIIQDLSEYEIISHNFNGVLREILSICNYAIHGEKLSANQVRFVSNNAAEVIEILKQIS